MHSPPRLRPPSPLNLQRLEKGAPLRTTTAASVTGTHVPPPHQNVKPTAMSLPRVPRPFAHAASACYVPFVRACIVVDSKPRNRIHNAAGPSPLSPINQPGVPSIHVASTRTTRPLAHSPTRLLAHSPVRACARLPGSRVRVAVRDAACAVRAPRPSVPSPRPPPRARASQHAHTHTHTHAAPFPRPTTRVTALNSCTLFYFRREKSPRHRRRSSGRGCSPSSSAPWPSAWASPPRRGPRAWL